QSRQRRMVGGSECGARTPTVMCASCLRTLVTPWIRRLENDGFVRLSPLPSLSIRYWARDLGLDCQSLVLCLRSTAPRFDSSSPVGDIPQLWRSPSERGAHVTDRTRR